MTIWDKITGNVAMRYSEHASPMFEKECQVFLLQTGGDLARVQ
jgi:hypothetical protein